MDVKKFPALIVGVVVALVLAGAVLPVFAETTSAEDRVINDGYLRMSEITNDDTDTYMVSWVKEKPNIVTVNDSDVPIMNVDLIPSGGLTIMFNDNWLFRAYQTNGVISSIQYIRSVTSGGATATTDITAVMTSGEMTITVNGVEGTGARYTHALIPAVDGDYIIKLSNAPAYVLEDSRVIGFGLSNVNMPGGSGSQIGLKFDGDMDNGVVFSKWRGSTVTATFETPVFNTNSSKWVDVYALNDITDIVNCKLSSEADPTTAQTTVTYSYFCVPYDLGAQERVIHPDGPLTVLLNVLPLLAIAGLVTGAVVWFISRKG